MYSRDIESQCCWEAELQMIWEISCLLFEILMFLHPAAGDDWGTLEGVPCFYNLVLHRLTTDFFGPQKLSQLQVSYFHSKCFLLLEGFFSPFLDCVSVLQHIWKEFLPCEESIESMYFSPSSHFSVRGIKNMCAENYIQSIYSRCVGGAFRVYSTYNSLECKCLNVFCDGAAFGSSTKVPWVFCIFSHHVNLSRPLLGQNSL